MRERDQYVLIGLGGDGFYVAAIVSDTSNGPEIGIIEIEIAILAKEDAGEL